MIDLDLEDDTALVRGDLYVHTLGFYDSTDNNAPIDMSANSATYAFELRTRSNDQAIVGSVAITGDDNAKLQFEADVPDDLVTADIGAKKWNWDIERTEAGGIVTTIIGGQAEIKPDSTNSPGPP